MSTIRIYKVAEVLKLPSQEVIDLLRRDHGIEVKSASSTVEEVVARQFAERVSKEKGIKLPSGSIFTSTTQQRQPSKRTRTAKSKPEAKETAKPKLGPPRLNKAAKAARVAAQTETIEQESIEEKKSPPKQKEIPEEKKASAEKEKKDKGASQKTLSTGSSQTTTSRPSIVTKPTGRIAPPTLRLRVEEPRKSKVEPEIGVKSKKETAASIEQKQVASLKTSQSQSTPTSSQPPLGGPRPLPSQPIRSTTPSSRPLPPRPAVGYRPPPRPHRPQGKRSDRKTRQQAPRIAVPPPPVTRTITLAEGMTVKDLSAKLEVKAKEVLKKLIEKRLMMTINTTLDTDTATMIAREFGADVKMRTFEEEMVILEAEDTNPEDLVLRAPVVTVMGHVDHGKTSLLDAVRETHVAEREAGGITQHIGAYAVNVNDRPIVFLDTPGHAAFTTMRARGASVTDVVILVVAADDGVMPQTQEAIDHAKAADVPILVAINKIDKSDANPERVKQELAERELTPEDWGGQTVMVPVSATKKENLESLLEMILLVTEMGEHKANPNRIAAGAVLEAKIDRGRGPVATILVQDGTLNVGDNFIAGTVVGKVRALIDDQGKQIKKAGPSTPVEVLGLTGLPQPGDQFQAVADAAKARQIALLRQTQAKEKELSSRGSRLTLESLQQQLSEGDSKELPIVIKADVQGSAEVLAESLSKLGDERVKVQIIHTGVGAVNESDVLLASTSNAIVIAFNVRPDRNAATIAEQENVDIRKHSVIYHVTEEITQAMAGLLEPTIKEKQLGLAEVRETFKVPKFGTAGGCMVTDGRITKSGSAQARLVRDGTVVHEGRIGSLRRFKDDVSEVKSGIECGIAFESFPDIKVGDIIESYDVEKIAATV